jgi:hypothetical protein
MAEKDITLTNGDYPPFEAVDNDNALGNDEAIAITGRGLEAGEDPRTISITWQSIGIDGGFFDLKDQKYVCRVGGCHELAPPRERRKWCFLMRYVASLHRRYELPLSSVSELEQSLPMSRKR